MIGYLLAGAFIALWGWLWGVEAPTGLSAFAYITGVAIASVSAVKFADAPGKDRHDQ